MQCVAVCCSVLQCVAVCCSVLQCAAVAASDRVSILETELDKVWVAWKINQETINQSMNYLIYSKLDMVCVAVCCSVLQCAAVGVVCCSVMQRVAEQRKKDSQDIGDWAWQNVFCVIMNESCLYTLQHTATHCNTLQHTCNTLATHCNTLQHTAAELGNERFVS